MRTAALIAALLLGQTVTKMVTVNAWLPDSTIAQMTALGSTFPSTGHYQVLTGRFTYYLDGGLAYGPSWPGAAILSSAAPTLCSNTQLCNWDAGSGYDLAVAAGASGCFCSDVSLTCTAIDPGDSTRKTAPRGQALGAGQAWTSPTGTGCVAMPACGGLWTTLPDGGPDDPRPAACF